MTGSDALPRVLAIMGSGETAPTMARVHRRLVARLGGDRVAALLDTPYGFQENADEITARALEYFRENVGIPMSLAPLRRADEDALLRATALARIREATYLFAGPGSPSYALREWRETPLRSLVIDKLVDGGIVTFASAAALTLGARTIPVYEIYKVGEEPRWLEGLDILGRLGLPVAVIPHYDNAEGGSHDTRFCYMGERRLRVLEEQLPADHFIVGVDSHTALVLDFAAGRATVLGLGGVTVRVGGRSRLFEPGTTVAIDALRDAADDLRREDRTAIPRGGGHTSPSDEREPGEALAVPVGRGDRGPATSSPAPAVSSRARTPLLDEVHAHELRFEAALATCDRPEAVRVVLNVENLLVSWSRDTGGTDEVDRARAIFQALIVRLADGASGQGRDAASVAPLVDALVERRAAARADRDWATADRIRRALIDAGVELHDSPDGTTWDLLAAAPSS
jgi:cyanophycinase-like exopeptidase